MMKNKILIASLLLSNLCYADYTAKVFVENLIFTSNSTPPPPSTTCVIDPGAGTYGVKNISELPANAEGLLVGESLILYNGVMIGTDTATTNYPAGLTLGDYVASFGGLDAHKVCADDLSIYNPPAPVYTYNSISIPPSSIGTEISSEGFEKLGFAAFSPVYHPTELAYGIPISNGNGDRIMIEIFSDTDTLGPLMMIYIVKGNETINEQLDDYGNVRTWIDQYDQVLISNAAEDFKFTFNGSFHHVSNFSRKYITITNSDYNRIKADPSILTKIKFREK
jgi:hypothetical protein